MADDVKVRKDGSEENPAVLGPAVVNPDHKNAHLEDTLSFFLPMKDAKPASEESDQKEHTHTLHIPPAILPNGEKVSTSKPTGSLKIPPAVPAAGNTDRSSTETLRIPAAVKPSSSQENNLFTSPFEYSGSESRRPTRTRSTSGSKSEDSILNIPDANIDHTAVYHSYGFDAESIPEDTTILHTAKEEHITAKESSLLREELRETSRHSSASAMAGEVVMPELFKDPETERSPKKEPVSKPLPKDDAKPYVPRRAAVKKEPAPEEDLGETRVLPKVDESVSEPKSTSSAKPASSAAKGTASRSTASASSASSKKEAYESSSRKSKPSSYAGETGGYGNIPPADDKKTKKQIRRNRRLVFFTWVLVFFLIIEMAVGGTGLYIVNKMIQESPDLSLTDFVGEESSKIYDDKGQLITEVGVYLRENITYDKCPEALVDAFLSVEDSRFFSHFGFDIPRFTKAAIDNLKSHSFGQGGSTFTMQLVKNTYFSIESMNAEETGQERTKSIEYKVQQIYLAIKLERLLSKKEIFQLYLNKLNFGGNIRGVQRAAQYYFGKNCNELNLSESAMLAGIVNLPNRYNPYEYLDYGTTRRNEVLNLMNYHGYITEDELRLSKAIKVEDTLVGEHRKVSEDSQYQSYLDAVLEEAMALTGCDPTVKGMKIYTYLNRTMQETVEAIQNEETNVIYPDELMQVAMISMDNRNGAVIAIGGGRNYDGARLLNRATMNYKQPGSSVKPLLSYGLAFEYLGYTLDEVLLDKPITYPQESMVLVNANGHYSGDVTIKDAVGNSLNIPAIITLERVVNKIGSQKVVEYLQKIGFSRVKQEYFHLSYAIGGTTFETTCKELAGAHSMLINGGMYNQPHTIQKIILTADGSEFYPENLNVRALSSGSAYLACMLEENNVSGPYFNWMQILKRDYPVYAKTGTTDWGNDGVQYGIPKGQMKDKWMVASTSQYTNCVWVGYDMAVAGKETYYTAYKSNLNIPGNINKILLDKEEELYGVPSAIQQPDDVQEITYVYGSFPHVRPEYTPDGGGTVTSLASKAGIESMPLATNKEYVDYAKEEAKLIGASGMSARYDQNNVLTVSMGSGACAGGQKDISLHDAWNNIEMWGACLADLSWLNGGSGKSFWGTVYCDDIPVGEFSSEGGFFNGYVADLYGNVKVCTNSADNANGASACVAAVYTYDESSSGYIDEFGNWVPLEDYSKYGHWDDQGNWIGEGWWDENGFHH